MSDLYECEVCGEITADIIEVESEKEEGITHKLCSLCNGTALRNLVLADDDVFTRTERVILPIMAQISHAQFKALMCKLNKLEDFLNSEGGTF